MPGLERSRLWRAWQTMCVVVAVLGVLSGLGGCATHQRPNVMSNEDSLGAQPLRDDASLADDDASLADKAGEVGVVGLVIGVIVGGILLPILLL